MKEITIKELFEKNPDMRVLIDDDGNVTLKEPNGRWLPKWGEKYWYLDSTGCVRDTVWQSGVLEGERHEIGNIFTTKDKAEEAVERLKIRDELLDCGGKESHELKGGSMAAIYVGFPDGLDVDAGIQPGTGEIGFKSKEEAWHAIEKIGEKRILKYMFGIGE